MLRLHNAAHCRLSHGIYLCAQARVIRQSFDPPSFFSTHANHKTINIDDAKLILRKDKRLLSLLHNFCVNNCSEEHQRQNNYKRERAVIKIEKMVFLVLLRPMITGIIL